MVLLPSSSTIPTTRVKPSHALWTPSEGQAAAVRHMETSAVVALWADPGAGKTSITLAAFVALKDAGLVRNMLVIAPLRVCQLTWRQEAMKWDQFRHLKIVLLHGPKKDALLDEGDADIYLVNYEGIDWLCDRFRHRQLPFDIVCADEITKLKAHDSKRAKKLRAQTVRTPRKWGLTGTPAPNGYMDLFGQFLWLDGGAALGKYITHFRDLYFKSDFTGWNYVLQSGADARIEERLAPYVFRLAYDAMPLVPDVRLIELDKPSRAKYREMKKDMLLELPEGTVTAANAAAVQQKLSQMANGAVYYIDPEGTRRWAHIHDAKLDALEELMEELAGKQLIIAYEFGHDLERIQARFPDVKVLAGSEAEVMRMQDDWNSGKLRLIAAHPASVGHGLNLQQSSANHLCWFSATWNLEHWDQLIRRLRRQGSKAEFIVNHVLAVVGTIDELKLESLGGKDATQEGLLTARLLQGLQQELSEDSNVNHRGLERPGQLAGRGSVPERAERGTSGEVAGIRDLHAGAYQQGAGRGSERRGPHIPQPASGGSAGSARHAHGDAPGEGSAQAGDQHCLPPHHYGSESSAPSTDHLGGSTTMTGFSRLPTKAAAPAAAEPAARPAVKGWPTKTTQAAPAAPEPRAEAIRARVAPMTARPVAEPQQEVPLHEDQVQQDYEIRGGASSARGFFSQGVQQALEGGENDPNGLDGVESLSPTGYPPGEAERLAAKMQAVVLPPKASIQRKRKTDTPAATLADAVSDVKGVDQVNYAGSLANGVSLNFHGLPPAAIKAALQAIVDNL